MLQNPLFIVEDQDSEESNWPEKFAEYEKVLKTFSLKPKKGIYFLYDGDEIVYIGMAIDIPTRINVHRQQKKYKFNSAKYLLIENSKDRAKLERKFIKEFRPKFNIFDNPDNQHLMGYNRTISGGRPPIEIFKESENKNKKPFNKSKIKLKPIEKDILKKRHGIGGEVITLREIGEQYNLSKERIRQIQVKAHNKIKAIFDKERIRMSRVEFERFLKNQNGTY